MQRIAALDQIFSKLHVAIIGAAVPRRAKQCFAKL